MLADDELMQPGSAYYREALVWQQENFASASASARRAWTVALALGAIAVLLALALAALTPLKQVELRAVVVDRISGETRISNPIADTALTQNEALKKYWVNQYVRARLTYDYQDMEANYVTVRQLSGRAEFNRYHAIFDPKRADSPYQVYGEHTRIAVRVKAISFLDDDTASVRLDLQESALAHTRPHRPYVATLSFRFTLTPATEADRLINPLGFQITRWRLDAQVAEQD